nr:MAG TPA: hypothetical protein [Caudoviricetes sp.]
MCLVSVSVYRNFGKRYVFSMLYTQTPSVNTQG